ncbi:hypothetical protein ACFSR7_06245 [Cohnella sp. GCM10020058]|uniref:ParM/StbA family protein n=1 Tax=Cohnella sp. GCM10020058 TaxID=3317330 RepID=UPI00363F307D
MAKSEAPVTVIALDTGNGGMKIYSDYVKRGYIEAVVGRYEAPPSSSGRMARRQEATTYQIEADPQKYVAGYEAINKYKVDPIPLHSRSSLVRYAQPMFTTYAKIGLAMAVEGAPNMTPVLLITSTPSFDYHNPEVRSKLNSILNDLHKVNVNDERKVINVVQYEPMSETEAVLYDLYFDEHGNVADETILDEDILVINCGFGTSDISRFSAMDFIKLPKETLLTSFRDVYKRCADWLSQTLQRQIDVQDVAGQLESQHKNKIKTYTNVDGAVQGFDDVYHHAVKAVFADLIAELNGIIDDPDRFKRIITVGGAVEEWGPLFKDWNARRVQIPTDPQFSTARGMYKFGRYYELPKQAQAQAAKKATAAAKE